MPKSEFERPFERTCLARVSITDPFFFSFLLWHGAFRPISEYVPPNIDRAALLSRWSSLVPAPRLQTHIIQGANHKVDDPKAQESLCALVGRFLEGLGD